GLQALADSIECIGLAPVNVRTQLIRDAVAAAHDANATEPGSSERALRYALTAAFGFPLRASSRERISHVRQLVLSSWVACRACWTAAGMRPSSSSTSACWR